MQLVLLMYFLFLDQAKANYTHALDSGLTATLMEEDDSSADIFRCSLGHLPPNKQAEVRFAYVTELSLEPEGHLSFVLPTVLNPRYNPSVRGNICSSLGFVTYEPFAYAIHLFIFLICFH